MKDDLPDPRQLNLELEDETPPPWRAFVMLAGIVLLCCIVLWRYL